MREERVRVSPPLAQEAAARAPRQLADTAEAVEIPAEYRVALPFKPALPGRPRAAKTMQTPPGSRGLGETLEAGDDSFEKARDALPFMKNTMGSGVVLLPRLTVDQYASFCAELSVTPERSGEILARYHVLHEGAREALDARWRAQLASQPEVRAVFEERVLAFTAYVRARERP